MIQFIILKQHYTGPLKVLVLLNQCQVMTMIDYNRLIILYYYPHVHYHS